MFNTHNLFNNDIDIVNYLKNNKVDNFIKFPDYFNQEEISIKKTIGKIPLTETTDDKAIEKITSITRFSKNVALIDPMITHNLTNVDYKYSRKHKNDCSKIESNAGTKNKAGIEINACSYSLKKILKAIYNTNLFKEDLKIHIRTTINEEKIKHFKSKIKDNIKKWNFFFISTDKVNCEVCKLPQVRRHSGKAKRHKKNIPPLC